MVEGKIRSVRDLVVWQVGMEISVQLPVDESFPKD